MQNMNSYNDGKIGEFTEQELRDYLIGNVDVQTRARIAIERKREGSPVHIWFQGAMQRLNDPLNVNYGRISAEEDDRDAGFM